MAKSIQIGLRLSPELIKQLDKFATDTQIELQKNLPGFVMNRQEAIKILITEGLAQRGYGKAKKKK